MQESYEEEVFEQLQEKLRSLFKRQNLCTSIYFYNRMSGRLTIPLSLILEEASLVKVTRDRETVVEALNTMDMVNVKENSIKIIQQPTIKINVESCEAFKEIERQLEKSGVKHQISKRHDTDQFINLTVSGKDHAWLRKFVEKLENKIDYSPASLEEDIQFGIGRIKRLKKEHAKNRNQIGRTSYSIYSPPEVFVRKAVESSSEDEEETGYKMKEFTVKKIRNGKQRFKQKKVVKYRPAFNDDQFPSLQ